MSSINDALRRAKHHETRPESGGIPVAGPPRARKPFGAAALTVTVLLAAGAAALMFLQPFESREKITAQKVQAEKNTPRVSAQPPPTEPSSDAPAENAITLEAEQAPTMPAAPEPASTVPESAAPPAAEASPPVPEIQPPALVPAPDAMTLFKEAQAAQKAGREDAAIRMYGDAIMLNPDLVEAYLNIGNIFYHGRKDTETAERMYKRVLTIDPRNPQALNNLGVLYLGQGKYSLAEDQFAAAIESDPRFVDALYNLACSSAKKGRNTLAVSYLRRAARLDPAVIQWAADDKDLNSLKDVPEFLGFLQSKPQGESQ